MATQTSTISTDDALLAMGHTLWQKHGRNRVYINHLSDILTRRTQWSANACRAADAYSVYFDITERKWGGFGDWTDNGWVTIREAVKAEVAEFRATANSTETRCARCGVAINPRYSSYAAGVGNCCADCYDIAEEGE